jgi:ubiquinone/menaquinone biosynthesis C-methylase UbiE
MSAPNSAPSAEAQFGANASRRVEAIYLTGDVVRQRQHALDRLAPKAGERVLDIGCGPGLTSLALAEAVGPQGMVQAIDIAEPMLALARQRCVEHANVQVQKQDAAQLPYPDGSFDSALATQVYEYVPDVVQALQELRRVLRPGGRALIVDTDWESAVWSSRNDARMRTVLETWNQHIPWPQLPRMLNQALQRAGFSDVQVEVMPLLNTRFEPATYSVGMLDVIAAFVSNRGPCSAAEVTAWQSDVRSMDDHTGYFFSLNRYLFVARA